MTIGTYECLPTQRVLVNGGSMAFDDLANELMSIDPSRFRNIKNVEDAVNNHSICLENNGERVTYNKESNKYSKSGFEREVQSWLHICVPDMEKWQLYPFKKHSNSKECYSGIPWKEIPRDNSEEKIQKKYRRGVNYHCDFRCEGKDYCQFGCGASMDTIRKYFYVSINGLDEKELVERLGPKEFQEKFKDTQRTLEKKSKDDLTYGWDSLNLE